MLNSICQIHSNRLSVFLILGIALQLNFSGCHQSSNTSAESSDAKVDSSLSSSTGSGSNPADSSLAPVAAISFKKKTFNFGIIKPDQVVEHTYVFTNTGGSPLKVTDVKPGCGCTTPDWTKEEVAPGDSGKITVRFDPKGKVGKQKKSVEVSSNTVPNKTMLDFEAEIPSKP
jgi:hypothetical protein